MRKLWRKALNVGALVSVVLAIFLLITVNRPPVYFRNTAIFLSDRYSELALLTMKGRELRLIFLLPESSMFLLAPLPLIWFLITWWRYSRKWRGHTGFPIAVFVGLAFLWTPLVLVAWGARNFWDRLEIAIEVFIDLSLIALPVWVLIWSARYAAGTAERKRQNRIARKECVQCGYSLKGNVSGTCPECGAACNVADAASMSPGPGGRACTPMPGTSSKQSKTDGIPS